MFFAFTFLYYKAQPCYAYGSRTGLRGCTPFLQSTAQGKAAYCAFLGPVRRSYRIPLDYEANSKEND